MGWGTKKEQLDQGSMPEQQEFDSLSLLYQNATQNLRDLKRQQWVTTNYGVLVYAALVGIRQLEGYSRLNQALTHIPIIVGFAGLVVAIWGTIIISWTGFSIQSSRLQIMELESYFPENFRAVRGVKTEWNANYYRDLPIVGLLVMILVSGAALNFYFQQGEAWPGAWVILTALLCICIYVDFLIRGNERSDNAKRETKP